MKVVIVAKTRMGKGACIGGITFEGQSVRLQDPRAETEERFNLEYNVGEVWEIDAHPAQHRPPPHVEDVLVRQKRRLGRIEEIDAFIEMHMPPRAGGLEALFDGVTEATKLGALYIAERTGTPSYSTMFWRPDKPLALDTSAKRIRYRYPTEDGGRTLTFVGLQEPVPEIPAGILLRVSLAHWWRPEEMPEGELRCYVQLSGWFMGEEAPVAAAAETADVADAKRVLKRVFGFEQFRSLQEDVIANVLAGQDTLAVMPTGSGKSLCYQLPALLFPGLTVVVSPLISLMEDQVMQLQELDVPAVFLNSSLSYPEYLYNADLVRTGQAKLLYVAPETLLRAETLLLLDQSNVSCLTIDEAHCISEWGHDFRPEYRQLMGVRQRYEKAVCIGLTATATPRVRQDIKAALTIDNADEFIASFDRPNLHLAIEAKTDGLGQTLRFLEEHRDQSGIIYCSTRQQVDDLAAELQRRGWPALPYHAGMDAETRRRHQRQFSHDEVDIIVATIAFGMGIDKSNVRFVLHYNLPKNIESYYQQIGRAGRDGLPSSCLLLFSYQDVNTIQFFISQEADAQQRGSNMALQALLGFVETNLCRRRTLLAHFGEPDVPETCEACDNCLRQDEDLVDLTVPAQKFLSCMYRTRQMFGMTHIIKVLCGSKEKRIVDLGHDRLSTYNIGGEFSRKEWRQLGRQFIQLGLVDQDMEHGGLSITDKGWEVLRGNAQVEGVLPEAVGARPKVPAKDLDYDETLFELLRRKRLELAREAGIPPYAVFSDVSLTEMAYYLPQSRRSFAGIHGVGEAKLERYADEFLPIIRAYCEERGLAEKQQPVSRATSSVSSGRRREVVDAFNRGMRISELAEHFSVQERTIVGHLWGHLKNGGELRADGLLEESALGSSEQAQVMAAFAELGPELLRPVFDTLDGRVSFEELHLLRLHFLTAQKNDEPAPPAAAQPVESETNKRELMRHVVNLGQSREEKNVPELAAALKHADINIRRLAATALGTIGSVRGADPLLQLLEDEAHPQVRQYAVKSLGKIGDVRALPILEEIAQDFTERDYTRAAARAALRQIEAARSTHW